MTAACRTCRFREPDPRPDYDGAGWCRRNPPALNVTTDSIGDSFYHQDWPWMHATDWCGEWSVRTSP